MEKVNLIKITNPFSRTDRECSKVEFHGESLQILRDLYFPNDLNVVVSLNGVRVLDKDLYRVIPKDGDFITIIPIVSGGDSGKDVVRALAFIAVAIASWGVGNLIAGGTGFLWATGATWTAAASLAAMGVLTLGGLLINTLLPPVAPELGDVGYGDSTSQTYGWNPQTTQQQGLCLPKPYGLNKMKGNIISTHIDNTKPPAKYLNTLLALGLGPVNRVYDYKINNQSYETFTGVEIFARNGELTQTVIPNFDDTKTEYSVNQKILSGATYTYTTVGNAFDRLEIEIAYPSGIYEFLNDASTQNLTGKVQVKIKGPSDPDYKVIREAIQVTGTTPVTWTGEWSAGYWYTDNYDGTTYWKQLLLGSSSYSDHKDGESAGVLDDGLGNTFNAEWRWMGNVTYDTVTTYSETVNIPGDGRNPVVKTFIEDIPSDKKGTYIISVTNSYPSNSTSRIFVDCYLSAVREVVRDDFTYPRIALASLKSLATDQLSGSFDFSCLMEGALVAKYVGTTTYTGYTITYTNNPAWVCFDVLTQPVIDNRLSIVRWDGINPARCYIQDFIDWADWCDVLITPTATGVQEKRITFNGVFDAQMNMWEAAWKVCQVGRASLIWRGTDLHVVIDKETDPVQLFTVGNIGIDSFKETFLSLEDRASEIEVDFVNSEKDYERDKLTVINTSIDNPSNKISLQLLGITKSTEAWRAANYRLLNNQHVLRTIEFDVDIDAIACTVGDVIRVQHDVPSWGYGGRIVAATTTTVVLDKEVSYTDANGEITIRLNDDTVVTKALDGSGSGVYTVTVATDFAVVPSQYDVYALGETTYYVKDYRIVDISRTNDLQCHIVAVQYDADVYSEDDSGANVPDTVYNAFNPYVSLTAVTLREDGYVDTSDKVVRTINVGYTIQDNALFNHADIFYKEDGTLDWLFAGSTRTNRFTINGVNPLTTYTVKPVGTNNLGLVTPDNMCATAVVTTSFIPSSLKIGNITVGSRNGATTGMYQSLEDAVDAVEAAGGGSILLKNGTYTLASTITFSDVDIEIRGESRDGVIIKNNPGDSCFYIHNCTSNYKFSNFHIQSQNTGSYSSLINIVGDTDAENTTSVSIENIKMTLVDDSTPAGSGDIGVFVQKGQDGILKVRKCEIINGAYGVDLSISYLSDTYIVENVFTGQQNYGIAAAFGKRVFIDKNILIDMENYGINAVSLVTGTVRSITNNKVFSVTNDNCYTTFIGIQASSVYGIDISNNSVHITTTKNLTGVCVGIDVGFTSSTQHGIIVSNTVLIDIASECLTSGIRFRTNSYSELDSNIIKIDNSDTTNLHMGINLMNASTYNIVSLNNIDMVNSHATKDVGIYTEKILAIDSSNNSGNGNKIVNYGIAISDNGTNNTINKVYGGTIV